jgi:hypothetical protein
MHAMMRKTLMEIILYIFSDKVLVVRDVLVDADGMKACEFADLFRVFGFMRIFLWWKQNTTRECVSLLLPSSSKDCGGGHFSRDYLPVFE